MKQIFNFLFGSYIKFFRDMRNYLYIRSQFSKYKNTPESKSFRLRMNWVGVIYTIINLRPEEAGEEPDVMKTRVLQKIGPFNDYIGDELGLNEILIPKITPIDSLNYKLDYYPYLPNTNLWIILKIIGVIYLIIWSHHKYDLLHIISDVFIKIISFFSI